MPNTENLDLQKIDSDIKTIINGNLDKIDAGTINKNGTVPFVAEQIGVDPTNIQGLATKNYVDTSILELGDTSDKAHPGDKGNSAYVHSQTKGNVHDLTKEDIGLGNVQNVDTTTTANVTDSTDKRFVTDAQKAILINTSGINTGDETASSIETKLGVTDANIIALSSLSGVNTGDETNESIKTKLGTDYTDLATKTYVDEYIGDVYFTANTSDMPTMANNFTDVNNDIDFSAGFCFDLSTKVRIENTALTKRLDAAFAEGANQGGLDIGIKTSSTIYACFAISKEDGTSDFLFSTSGTSPTMPSGFICKRRIGWIRTDDSGNIQTFYQHGDYISRASVYDLYLTNTPTVSPTNLTTSIPPDCIGKFRVSLIGASTSSDDTCVGIGDLHISGNNAITVGTKGVANGREYNNCLILVNSNSQMLYSVTCAGGNAQQVVLTSFGYIDKRGVN